MELACNPNSPLPADLLPPVEGARPPERTCVCGFHCNLDLVFACLNLFKSLQSQPTADIYPSNLIQTQLEIEVAMQQPPVPQPLTKHIPSQKGVGFFCFFFVIIDFAACLSHFDRRRVWESALTKLVRLIWRGCSLFSQKPARPPQHRNVAFTLGWG